MAAEADGTRCTYPLSLPMSEHLPAGSQLDLEFAFTTWQDSCHDPSPTFQECRRRRGHVGEHAAGFGDQRTRWPEWWMWSSHP